jgi:hypothetical protein
MLPVYGTVRPDGVNLIATTHASLAFRGGTGDVVEGVVRAVRPSPMRADALAGFAQAAAEGFPPGGLRHETMIGVDLRPELASPVEVLQLVQALWTASGAVGDADRAHYGRAAVLLAAEDGSGLALGALAAIAARPDLPDRTAVAADQVAAFRRALAEENDVACRASGHWARAGLAMEDMITGRQAVDGPAVDDVVGHLGRMWADGRSSHELSLRLANLTWRLVCLVRHRGPARLPLVERTVQGWAGQTTDAPTRRWFMRALELDGPVPESIGFRIVSNVRDLPQGGNRGPVITG